MSETVSFTCGVCKDEVGPINISSFHPKVVITQLYVCSKGHVYNVSVRGGLIVDIKLLPQESSDIDDFINVSQDLKEILKEAYTCKNAHAPRGGASMVRLLLDGLMFELGFQDNEPFNKVSSFETKCRNDNQFLDDHKTLFRRVPTFKTIAGLAGYHMHPQKKLAQVSGEEFNLYLQAVESAIKEKWPERRP